MEIQLTVRDIKILIALFTSRYLTTDQIRNLFWYGSSGVAGPIKACARRLRKLYKAGYIRFIEQPVMRGEGTRPYIWTLDKGGAEVVSAELGIPLKEVEWRRRKHESNYPFLRHILHTNDLHNAVYQATEHIPRITLQEWHDEKMLKSDGMKDYVYIVSSEGRWHKTAVVPDAVFRLKQTVKHRPDALYALFMAEIDEATVTIKPSTQFQRSWSRRIQTYIAYFDSEAYRDRYGFIPARVLTVTTSMKRLTHLKEATEEEGGGIHFLFALFEDATDPSKLLTGKIWYQAKSDERFSLMG